MSCKLAVAAVAVVNFVLFVTAFAAPKYFDDCTNKAGECNFTKDRRLLHFRVAGWKRKFCVKPIWIFL